MRGWPPGDVLDRTNPNRRNDLSASAIGPRPRVGSIPQRAAPLTVLRSLRVAGDIYADSDCPKRKTSSGSYRALTSSRRARFSP
jgi:hypothetical protein